MKLKSTFRSERYHVLDRSGNHVVVESTDGVQYRRNFTHVKKFLERNDLPEIKISLSPPTLNTSTEHEAQPSANESAEHSGETRTYSTAQK